MKNLCIGTFSFHLSARTEIRLPPYKGSTLRGGFGHAFKRVTCVARDKDCQSCLLKHKCVYASVFESPIPLGSRMMRKYKATPHPFVIRPPDEKKREYHPGDTLGFGLILVGRIADYLPYFIYAFEELGRIGIGKGRGKYSLLQVTSAGEGGCGESRLVYSGIEKVLTNSFKLHTFEEAVRMAESFSNQEGLTVRFLTPTRIIYNGQLAPKPEFHIILRNLLRRLSLLSYFYCDGNPEETDFRSLIKQAENIKTDWIEHEWHDWERYSSRQEARMKLGGFMGTADFTGNLKPFLPHFIMGQRTHIGKGTSFGLGRFLITFCKEAKNGK